MQTTTRTNQFRPIVAVLFVLTYVLIRFYLIRWIDTLGPYASYGFEIAFVAVAFWVYRSNVRVAARPDTGLGIESFVAVILGFGIYEIANYTNIPIPFDLTSIELVVMLILLGPVLEECIFRQALWHPLEVLVKRPWAVVALTSVIFSFAHFYSYFFVPEQLQVFVIYQTLYTLAIGVWWGMRYSKQKVLSTPIILHVAFNLGFYLGFLL